MARITNMNLLEKVATVGGLILAASAGFCKNDDERVAPLTATNYLIGIGAASAAYRERKAHCNSDPDRSDP